MRTEGRDFLQRVVAAALLVRLGAIAVALVGLTGHELHGNVLVCILVLSFTSFVQLYSPAVEAFVARHPLTVILDILLALGTVAVVGVESPLVLATFSTALVVGLIFDRRVAVAGAVVLVAGYGLVLATDPHTTSGFMTTLGVPTLYVALVAVGGVVRQAHERDTVAHQLLAETKRAAAAADERARLAREMHDSLGKTLHGVALAAQTLPSWVDSDPDAAREHARLLADGAHRAAAEARGLLTRMRADQPDRPLAQVLAELCATWQGECGTPCHFRADRAVDLSTAARYEVLAVVAEALENVRRHARASTVGVVLAALPDGRVQVEVRDDGVGFSPSPDGAGPRGHYGLVGMRERAQSVGAELTVASAPGEGTSVVIEVDPEKEVEGVA
ncbi:integral membrane sensor signal transduction histidine kinase [Cellulomonas flavigena DSM 20109]|uniref:Integral membrane sensor signal transduction histidine kinase n=1 Tax=Cellulomonas flavigena (strain ATCC 482 / DSM 20109 / BCRC 11376 / JCM 18109 / NBRC 3775 / NCIMB 8073 / NRS 134) TaxID=446466 RepID=D5UIA7_CELFN|nr:histidine kinase [Cellulomonas flavigena]ADG75452.1 integral membrane sensor signal transduction histidine kinase [Cellulomonas flavigena DSM 20109]